MSFLYCKTTFWTVGFICFIWFYMNLMIAYQHLRKYNAKRLSNLENKIAIIRSVQICWSVECVISGLKTQLLFIISVLKTNMAWILMVYLFLFYIAIAYHTWIFNVCLNLPCFEGILYHFNFKKKFAKLSLCTLS